MTSSSFSLTMQIGCNYKKRELEERRVHHFLAQNTAKIETTKYKNVFTMGMNCICSFGWFHVKFSNQMRKMSITNIFQSGFFIETIWRKIALSFFCRSFPYHHQKKSWKSSSNFWMEKTFWISKLFSLRNMKGCSSSCQLTLRLRSLPLK